MAKMERGLREFLSVWQFWMVVAYVGLAAVVVALYVLFGRTAHDEAIRAAAQKSAATSQAATCFISVKNAPVIAGFLQEQDALIDNGLLANLAAIKASGPSDPLNGVRERAVIRLTAAKANERRLERLIATTTPTKAKCLVLAHKLGVNTSAYTN